jgi:Mg2+ and Co2+ transporter CorA
VAIGAYPRRHGVHSHQCEARVVVIKRGIGPVNRVVAGFARRRESSRCMRRVGRTRVVLLVTRVAQRAIE